MPRHYLNQWWNNVNSNLHKEQTTVKSYQNSCIFSEKRIHLKVSSAKWWQSCMALRVLKDTYTAKCQSQTKCCLRFISLIVLYSFIIFDVCIVIELGVWCVRYMMTSPNGKHYWPYVRGIHQSPVNFRHKGHRQGALIFSLICAWTSDWANSRYVGDFRRHRSSWRHCNVLI